MCNEVYPVIYDESGVALGADTPFTRSLVTNILWPWTDVVDGERKTEVARCLMPCFVSMPSGAYLFFEGVIEDLDRFQPALLEAFW